MQSLFGLTPRAIRYYESVGLIETIRTRTNARIFDARARERLRWIARLRAAGVPLEGIRDVVELDADPETKGQQAAMALTKLSELSDQLRSEQDRVENAKRELEEELLSSRRPRPVNVEAEAPPRPPLRKFA